MSDSVKRKNSWHGPLAWDRDPPIMWKVGQEYKWFEPPNSVTFPICAICGYVILDWPHFEEEVPKEAICDTCAKDA